MLRDPEKKLIYVPVSEELMPQMTEWSDPVQVRIEHDAVGDPQFVFRRVGIAPIAGKSTANDGHGVLSRKAPPA